MNRRKLLTVGYFIELESDKSSLQKNEELPILNKSENCLISIPSIVFTIEAGIGTKTMPMLLTECTFNGSINNWSSKVSLYYPKNKTLVFLNLYLCNMANICFS